MGNKHSSSTGGGDGNNDKDGMGSRHQSSALFSHTSSAGFDDGRARSRDLFGDDDDDDGDGNDDGLFRGGRRGRRNAAPPRGMFRASSGLGPRSNNNVFVFLDIEVNKAGSVQPVGRIVIELFKDVCPNGTENFRALCTGEKGIGKAGTALHYKGCHVHRVIKKFMLQSGDITRFNGTGGEAAVPTTTATSRRGAILADENFELKHDRPGLLSWANAGPNTTTSQFFITFAATPWLDGKHTVFGQVVDGFDTVCKEIENDAVDGNSGKTRHTIIIGDCGQLDGPPSSLDSMPPREKMRSAAAESGAPPPPPSSVPPPPPPPSRLPLETLHASAPASDPNNPVCFLDFADAATGHVLGRVRFEVFRHNGLPRTAENFLTLCSESRRSADRHLTYRGSPLHRVMSGGGGGGGMSIVQFGDNTKFDGLGGKSIYGTSKNNFCFDDESYVHAKRLRNEIGLLCTASSGANRNQSQVYVNLAHCPHLVDNLCHLPVVFGKVVDGLEVLRHVADQAGTATGVPKRKFQVCNCGTSSQGSQLAAASSSTATATTTATTPPPPPPPPPPVSTTAISSTTTTSSGSSDGTIKPPFVRAFENNELPAEITPLVSQFMKIIECAICLESYDAYSRIPTTLPCGHSCCLKHVNLLSSCAVCRAPLAPSIKSQLQPNFAMKSILEILAPTDEESIAESKRPRPRARTPPRPSTTTSSFDTDASTAAEMRRRADAARASQQAAVEERRRYQQAYRDQHVAGSSDTRDGTWRSIFAGTTNRPVAERPPASRSPPPPTRGHRGGGRAAAAASSSSSRASGGAPRGCDGTCSNRCSIVSSQRRCCFCMDQREMKPEGTYEAYVDGAGWVATATRAQHYCPYCRGVAGQIS